MGVLEETSQLLNTDDLFFITCDKDGLVKECTGPLPKYLGLETNELLRTKLKVNYLPGAVYSRPHKSGKLVSFVSVCFFELADGGSLLIEKPAELLSTTSPLNGLPSLKITSIPAASSSPTSRSNENDNALINFLDSEIRNPLTGIDSTSQLLMSSLETCLHESSGAYCTCGKPKSTGVEGILEQSMEDVEYLMYCAKYIRSILSNQLDLPRLRSGTVHLQPSVVNLSKDIVNPIMKMLYSQKSDNVRVDIDCNEDLKVNTDSYRLSQLLESVLGMAFRTTTAGTVSIRSNIVDKDANGVSKMQPISEAPMTEEESDEMLNDANKQLQIIIEATADRLNDSDRPSSQALNSSYSPKRRSSVSMVDVNMEGATRPLSFLSGHISPPLSPSGVGMGDRAFNMATTSTANNSWLELAQFVVKVMEGKMKVTSSAEVALNVVITLPLSIANLSASIHQKRPDLLTTLVSKELRESPRPGTLATAVAIAATGNNTEVSNSARSSLVLANSEENKLSNSTNGNNNNKQPTTEEMLMSEASLADHHRNLLFVRSLRALIVAENAVAIKARIRLLETITRGTSNTFFSNNVITAYTGEEALDIFEKDQGRFDLFLIDENLSTFDGVLSGHEVIEKLRSAKKYNTTVMIGVINDKSKSKPLFMEAGADVVWEDVKPSLVKVVADISQARIKKFGQVAAQLPGCKHLLLIDDSEVIVKHFIKRLKLVLPASWIIRSRSSLDLVLKKLLDKAVYFDVIITGENFGRNNIVGSEFIRKLRENDYRGILIGCTGDLRFIEKHLECGADLAWTKPPPSNELIVSQFINLREKLLLPEPFTLYRKQLNKRREALSEAVVASVTAFNHGFDTGIKVITKRKITKRGKSASGEETSQSSKTTTITSTTTGEDLSIRHGEESEAVIDSNNNNNTNKSGKSTKFDDNVIHRRYKETAPVHPDDGWVDSESEDEDDNNNSGAMKTNANLSVKGNEKFIRTGGGRRNAKDNEDESDEDY